MATRTENKKELAYLLYMQEVTQKEICERVGIGSSRTLTSWIQKGSWKEKRAAKTITRTELINKALDRISTMLEQDEVNADQLSKFAATIEKLDKQDSAVAYMECFTAFAKFLQQRSYADAQIDLDFLKKVNHYQDLFITNKINS